MSTVTRIAAALGGAVSLWVTAPAAFAQSDPDVAALQVVLDITAEQHGAALERTLLMDAALAGVAGWLNDFHQSADHEILSLRQYQAQRSILLGEGYGFGIDIRPIPGHGARIVDVFVDSPADRAGLSPGMTILGVDGNAFAGQTPTQILSALGNAVTAHTGRQTWVNIVDTAGTMDAKAVRLGRFRIPPLSAAHHEDHSLVTLRCLCPEAAALLQRALAQNANGRVVLDLRHSEGEDVDLLLAVAAPFLGGDRPVGYFDAHGQPTVELRTRHASRWEGRVAVLIGEQTRGTAELLAHALRSESDAPLFGAPTAGETSVPAYHTLPGDRVLRSVSGWLRGSTGAEFAGTGLQPDANGSVSTSVVISPLLPSPDLQYDSALKWLRSEE